MILITKPSDQTRHREHTRYLYNSYLSSEYLVLAPLLPCCSLDYLGWQLMNQPFLFYIFFSFPARRLRLFCVFLRFFASLPLSPILFSFPFPLSSSPFPSPLLYSISSPFPSAFPSGVRLRVPLPVPVLVPAPSPYPSPSPSCAPSFTSIPVPVPAPSPPHARSRPRYHLRSNPRLQSRPRPRSLLPALRTRLPHRYDELVQTPCLANGAVGCSQAPPPVCRESDACGMRVPAVKQKTIAAEDMLLLSLPPDVGTHWSMSPTCAVPV